MDPSKLANLVVGWPLLSILLCYSIAPYTVLWLVVRCWPKGHPHRDELLAEYAAIPVWERPLRVADTAVHCVLHGTAARWRGRRPSDLSIEKRVAGLALLGPVLGSLPAAIGLLTGKHSVWERLVFVAVLSMAILASFMTGRHFRRTLRAGSQTALRAEQADQD